MTILIIIVGSFLALFLIIFLFINIRKKIKKKRIAFSESERVIFGGAGLIDEDLDDEPAVLEDISAGSVSIFWQPFTFSLHNLVLLQKAEDELIYEQNGIHYISNNAFIIDRHTEEKLDNDFMKLVESVTKI